MELQPLKRLSLRVLDEIPVMKFLGQLFLVALAGLAIMWAVRKF